MHKNIIIGLVALIVLVGAIAAAAFFMLPLRDAGTPDTATTTPAGGTAATAPAASQSAAPVATGSATIDPVSFTTASASPLLQGTATGELVLVAIIDGEKVLWRSQVPVREGVWAVLGTLPGNAVSGTRYSVEVRANGEPTGALLAEGSFVYEK